jgi:hypothetical protein
VEAAGYANNVEGGVSDQPRAACCVARSWAGVRVCYGSGQASTRPPPFPLSHGHLFSTALRRYLKAGGDPNVRRSDGSDPLGRAIFHDRQEAVKALLRVPTKLSPSHRPVSLNVRCRGGLSYAGLAAGKSSLAVLRLLVSAGADVNMTSTAGNSALHELVLGEGTELDAKLAFLLSLPQVHGRGVWARARAQTGAGCGRWRGP